MTSSHEGIQMVISLTTHVMVFVIDYDICCSNSSLSNQHTSTIWYKLTASIVFLHPLCLVWRIIVLVGNPIFVLVTLKVVCLSSATNQRRKTRRISLYHVKGFNVKVALVTSSLHGLAFCYLACICSWVEPSWFKPKLFDASGDNGNPVGGVEWIV